MNQKWLLALLIVVLALVAAQCGGTAPAPAPEGEADQPAASEGGGETAVESEPAAEAAEAGSDEVELAPELSVYNWADYIDESILEKYEQEYGVEIIYDTFASNEDLLAKLQAGATGYDVIFPSDYMVTQMIDLGMLAEINHDNIPNLKNLDAKFQDPPNDPGNKHCAPYQWGTTGIAYRTDVFGDEVPDSWAYIFDPEQAQKWAEAGGINVLNDQRELIGSALKYLGYSLNDTDETHLQEARDLILAVKPYIKSFNSEDYDDSLMVPGEVILSHAWNGDAAQTIWKTADEETGESPWAFVVPKEGAFVYHESMCIPVTSTRKETAEHFINFILDAENGATITNYTYYASANAAAREFILPEILEDPSIYPSEEAFQKLEWGQPLGEAIFIYDRVWTEVKSQ